MACPKPISPLELRYFCSRFRRLPWSDPEGPLLTHALQHGADHVGGDAELCGVQQG